MCDWKHAKPLLIGFVSKHETWFIFNRFRIDFSRRITTQIFFCCCSSFHSPYCVLSPSIADLRLFILNEQVTWSLIKTLAVEVVIIKGWWCRGWTLLFIHRTNWAWEVGVMPLSYPEKPPLKHKRLMHFLLLGLSSVTANKGSNYQCYLRGCSLMWIIANWETTLIQLRVFLTGQKNTPGPVSSTGKLLPRLNLC